MTAKFVSGQRFDSSEISIIPLMILCIEIRSSSIPPWFCLIDKAAKELPCTVHAEAELRFICSHHIPLEFPG